jgi:hypothetical protein
MGNCLRLGKLCVGFLLLSFCAIAAPSQAVAISDGVQIDQNDAWVDFPQSVDFHLVVTGAGTIDSVHVEYGVNALTCGDVTTVAAPDFEPGPKLDVTWRWEVASSGVIPPGAEIWWRWRLVADDEEIVTPMETVSFDDAWFVWESLTDRQLEVRWYRGSRPLVQEMLDAGHEALDQLAADTGLYLDEPIVIYLYEEPGDLRASIPGAPRWAGGIAFPEYNTVMVVVNEECAAYGRLTVRHELGHLVIRRFTFNCLADLPVWLNEGLAMVAEGEEDTELMTELDAAVAEDRLLTISQIESAFSVHRDRAKLSYAQSYSLVRFLIDTYGQEKMLDLLMAFREGVTPDEAFKQAYGFDTYGLEDAWRAAIGAPALALERDPVMPTPIPTLALAALPTAVSTLAPTAELDDTPLPTETAAARVGPGESAPAVSWVVWAGGAFGLLVLVITAVWRLRRT